MDTGPVCEGPLFCIAYTDGRDHVYPAKTESSANGSCASQGDDGITLRVYRILPVLPGRIGIVLGSQ